ncbi:tol-pal system protein YbgF [Bradyrhizobium sp. SZCCHNPS2010]|uniref:tol-pal system protein YbgF n=1 Tax=Bradyrhizobium sp. SZCCHNPS2010 TaxID=3057333 RepID=UPI002916DC1F|nr:tol-pal system protein YbgF [Bradyrhizobium sp. SZCCHNPS2010]
MSSKTLQGSAAAAVAAFVLLSSQLLPSQAFAQADEDPEVRIERLENQLRQLTGQNEELQYRNRQLEERLRQLQGGVPGAPGAPAASAQPSPAYGQPAQPVYAQPAQPQYGSQPQTYSQQPGYGQPQGAAPAPIAQDSAANGGGRRRGDAFDPGQNPGAPGAPQALGGGQLPIQPGGGAPSGRPVGEPMDLANTPGRYPQGAAPAAAPGPRAGGLDTAPPTQSPRDEYDLGIGYMQRKDYALAEQTMRNFGQKYPNDPMVGDSQYWLGESFFQRQQYRDAAEVFLAVTTKYEKSGKAPDALLRLGQSLAALKEKEAACAAFGEVTRKYPRASAGVKAAVDREQKKVKC